jgi:hypothetical protein
MAAALMMFTISCYVEGVRGMRDEMPMSRAREKIDIDEVLVLDRTECPGFTLSSGPKSCGIPREGTK